MNARHSSAGDGSADTGNPAAYQPDPYQRQIEALDRLIVEHAKAHSARIETLRRQSESYLATLQEEKRLLVEAREGQRSGEAEDGAAPRDA
jgi:hypothetical protein